MVLSKRKNIFIFTLLCFLLLLGSCTKSSYLAIASTEIDTNQQLARTYQKLDGELNKQIKITQETTMSIQVNTIDGVLNIIIYDENNTACFNQASALNGTYQVPLSPGSYQIHIQAEKHQGSYNISW